MRSALFEALKWTPYDDRNDRYPYREFRDIYSIRFSNLYLRTIRKCVTQNINKSIEDIAQQMSKEIKAIPYHYMDFIGASLEDRENVYHKYCDATYCKFKMCSTEVEKISYQPTTSDNKQHDGDLYIKPHHIFGEGTKAMSAIIEVFENFSRLALLKKCTRYRSTNINESLHARLYRLCKKTDHYSKRHIAFAAQKTMIVHNHGYASASLLHKYGFNRNQIDRLHMQDAFMRKKAAKPTVRRRDQILNFKDKDIHYHSNHGFELEDPLPLGDEFSNRKLHPWRNLKITDEHTIDSDNTRNSDTTSDLLPDESIDISIADINPEHENENENENV